MFDSASDFVFWAILYVIIAGLAVLIWHYLVFLSVKSNISEKEKATFGGYLIEKSMMRDAIAVERSLRRHGKKLGESSNKQDQVKDHRSRAPCPRCKEMIIQNAPLCRFCKSNLPANWHLSSNNFQ